MAPSLLSVHAAGMAPNVLRYGARFSASRLTAVLVGYNSDQAKVAIPMARSAINTQIEVSPFFRDENRHG